MCVVAEQDRLALEQARLAFEQAQSVSEQSAHEQRQTSDVTAARKHSLDLLKQKRADRKSVV